jgi:hypothetical protein
VPYLELNLVPTAEDMPDMARALIRAIIAAADKDQDEMTVLLISGEPAVVIAPYEHERRPGAVSGNGSEPAGPRGAVSRRRWTSPSGGSQAPLALPGIPVGRRGRRRSRGW